MNDITFDLNKYEIGVGPIFVCQLSIKMFIEDITNDFNQRKYAETIYEWLGLIEYSIDELCQVSYDKTVFILQALEKYKIQTTDSNLILNYGDAVGSLKYQIYLINYGYAIGSLKYRNYLTNQKQNLDSSLCAEEKNNNIKETADEIEEDEIEQKTYNGIYYADAMDMEAAMKKNIK